MYVSSSNNKISVTLAFKLEKTNADDITLMAGKKGCTVL